MKYLTYKKYLHLYTSRNYEFIIYFWGENIYIKIDNINMSRKKSCLEDVPNILVYMEDLTIN